MACNGNENQEILENKHKDATTFRKIKYKLYIWTEYFQYPHSCGIVTSLHTLPIHRIKGGGKGWWKDCMCGGNHAIPYVICNRAKCKSV